MSRDIYEMLYIPYTEQRHMPKEIEEMYVEKYGQEPKRYSIMIFAKMLKR